ncbi:glycosyl hydrolase family 17 protein [Belliella kenyensis]|uniref:Endo-1,3-beta-glucanase btgC n=1 Tax=Belliella kenyensis TaxID=1472724 RepID=A0ABV8EJ35_9BACT|nr:glycosyl hydrolase family 17 protein [Belliella kenyensis]MCH7400419.1 glycosyl hydrolase family 17 protein [Belliella kenyensis]MDN3604564.1 glycosyl hydrolase family 17 protein [Belliella kenyensis]
MSFNADKILALAGKDLNNLSLSELVLQFRKTINLGIHGLCFSPYEEGQEPGDQLTEDQIRRRIEIIRPHTQWIRSFSCTEGNELIPKIAKEYGLKTLVGAWLGKDHEVNKKEIENLITLSNQGLVDIAAVGNEVMYRKDLSESELLEFIQKVKNELPHIPVGYVDAYYEFEHRPAITEACDVILANCYPFWEGCALEYSLVYIKDMYHRALKAANGKKVIITETGWPSQGTPLYGAIPSDEHFMKYFISIQQWSKAENIEVHYFSSFDEAWKVGAEGDVGAYWGLWNMHEKLKY